MISNLKLSKSFDTLIEIDDELLLCKQSDIYNGVFGNDLCDYDILIKNDNGLLMQPNEQVNYSVAYFDDLYERVQPGDENDDTIYMDSDFDFDKIAVRKLSEIPSDIKRSFIDVEHGINTDEICVTDAHIICGKVYEAPLHTPQEYPTQEYEDASYLLTKKTTNDISNVFLLSLRTNRETYLRILRNRNLRSFANK